MPASKVNVLLAQGRGYKRAAQKKEACADFDSAKTLYLKASRAFLDAAKLVLSVDEEKKHKKTANMLYQLAMIAGKRADAKVTTSESCAEPAIGIDAGEPGLEASSELTAAPGPGPEPESDDEQGATPVSDEEPPIEEITQVTSRGVQKIAIVISKRRGEYEVGLIIPRKDEEPASVFEFIKVSPASRNGIIEEIERLAVVSNILWAGVEQGDDQRFQQSLVNYGKVMYGMFLTQRLQQYLKDYDIPLILESNDSELLWEIMHDDNNFLCLKHTMGRRLRSRDIPRMNPYKRGERLKFLFIANPLEDLESTENEVEYITERLRETAEIKMIKGRDATNVAVLGAMRSGEFDIIHYAGHAEFSRTSPDESALLLAKGDKLFAQEIKRALMGRPMVFINACSSGKEVIDEDGRSYTHSDTEGLASAFIFGGALGFIGTAWPVYDVSAAIFAANFYHRLLRGDTLGGAVRIARALLKQKRPIDINWASFILYGDPTLRLVIKH